MEKVGVMVTRNKCRALVLKNCKSTLFMSIALLWVCYTEHGYTWEIENLAPG